MAAAIGRDMAARRRAPGAVARARRRPRLPLGPGRGDDRRGPVPRSRCSARRTSAGLQSAGVLATLKHFAGYSASRAARNHGPVSMGRRELLDVILPPFETAVALAGAGSVMNSYSDVDGVPAGADPWLLTEVLRDEWGFAGTVVSDYWAVPFLATMHRVAADTGDAGALALTAGIDVELPDTIGFGQALVERVRRGEVAEELVDRAARRVLPQKVELGLLDPDWTPGGARSPTPATSTSTRPANRAIAREIAERSVVLLDAGTALPLLGEGRPALRRVAVVGPCADDAAHVHGLLRLPQPRAAALPRARARHRGADRLSTRCAPSCPDVEVVHEQGCAVQGDDRSGFAAAVEAARGRRRVRRRRRRPGRAVRPRHLRRGLRRRGPAAARASRPTCSTRCSTTGTPVVVVVVSGRPYALGDVAGRAAGLVQAFMPGEEGGGGDRRRPVRPGRSPSGKLPVQIPRHGRAGSPAPTCSRRWAAGERRASAASTRRRCSPSGTAARTPPSRSTTCGSARPRSPTDGEFTVDRAACATPATRAGDEVVQLYLRDVLAQVARPVRQLAGLRPGPARAGRAGRRAVPGARRPDRVHRSRPARGSSSPETSRCMVGTSAPDLPCRATVRLTGPTCGWSGTTADWTPRSIDARYERPGGCEPERRERRTVAPVAGRACDPGHRRGLRRRVGRHGLQGGQRSQRRRAGDPCAGAGRCWSEHEYVAPRGRRLGPAQPTVELVFHGELNAYSLEIIQGVLDAGGELGVAVVVSLRTRGSADGTRRAGPALGPRLVAAGRRAVIARDQRADRARTWPRCRGPGCRSSSSTRSTCPAARVTSVGSTNFTGGLAATQHLLSLGHRRIAYVGGPADRRPATRPGCSGFRAAMEADGAPGAGRVRPVPATSSTTTAWPAAPRCSTCRSRRPRSSPASDEMALGRHRGGPGARSAGPRGSQRRRLRRHPGRPARLPAADHRAASRCARWAASRCAPALRLAAGEKVDSHHVELATELVVRHSTAPPAPR